MYSRHLVASFCLSLALLSGCDANAQTLKGSSAADSDQTRCIVDTAAFKHLPRQVLVGTDIQQRSDFPAASAFTGKHYQAEMGGATLTLSIERDGRSLRVQRTYQEAGMAAAKRTYEAVCRQGDLLDGTSLKGMLVRGGLLVLETHSGVEGIPGDLWVLYHPTAPRNDHRKGTSQ
ncbi:hypothetical protein [Mangrovitalea sediminis]|uniref:hypothetical protein n=1 Tax=Mangrovitalea sediminis TaxID=1982043 RepID=UPI000BE52FEE|nr:hypothetical protein [Mangrovitalea sediminis]